MDRNVLSTYDEAPILKTSELWTKVTDEETHEPFNRMSTWELVQRPPNQNVGKARQIFDAERKQEGVVVRDKTSLVAKYF